MKKLWTDSAWEDYLRLQGENPSYVEQLNQLIHSIDQAGPEDADPFGKLEGYYSIKVNEVDCLVFKYDQKMDEIIIQAVKNHG